MIVNGVAEIVRAATVTDGYGQDALDWDDTTETDAGVVWLTQTSATEDNDTRTAELTTAGLTVWNPAIDVTAADRIVYAGAAGFLVFEVVGRPHIATTPRGPHHIELQLRSVEG